MIAHAPYQSALIMALLCIQICKDPPKSLKATAAVAVGGKRVGGGGRARPVGANGSVDDDVIVSTSTVGGETVKVFKIKIGKDFLQPKVIDGHLYLTTVTSASAAEVATEAAAGAAVDDAGENEE